MYVHVPSLLPRTRAVARIGLRSSDAELVLPPPDQTNALLAILLNLHGRSLRILAHRNQHAADVQFDDEPSGIADVDDFAHDPARAMLAVANLIELRSETCLLYTSDAADE